MPSIFSGCPVGKIGNWRSGKRQSRAAIDKTSISGNRVVITSASSETKRDELGNPFAIADDDDDLGGHRNISRHDASEQRTQHNSDSHSRQKRARVESGANNTLTCRVYVPASAR